MNFNQQGEEGAGNAGKSGIGAYLSLSSFVGRGLGARQRVATNETYATATAPAVQHAGAATIYIPPLRASSACSGGSEHVSLGGSSPSDTTAFSSSPSQEFCAHLRALLAGTFEAHP